MRIETREARIALAVLLAALSGGPGSVRPVQAQAQAPPQAPAEAPSPRTTPDPLTEFVPHDKVEADSIVAFPVDI
jgi:hypothetical protein